MNNFHFGSLIYISVLVAVFSSGCATNEVLGMRRYYSLEEPERAVILRDGRVVVDFSRQKWHENYYYKRVYYAPDHFGPVQGRVGEAINKPEEILERRITRYLESKKADDEKGSWKLLDDLESASSDPRYAIELPPIPEQDSNNKACMNSTASVYYQNFGHRAHRFYICNDAMQTALTSTVNVNFERKYNLLHPSTLLFIPALAIDIVTLPVQLILYMYVIDSSNKLFRALN